MRCSQEFPIDYLRKIQTKYKTTVFCSGRNLKINKGPWIIRTFKGARGHARATLRIIWPHGWSKDLGPARQGPTCRAVRAVHASLVLRLLEKKTGDAKFRVCRTKLKSVTISRGWDKLDVFLQEKMATERSVNSCRFVQFEFVTAKFYLQIYTVNFIHNKERFYSNKV